MKTAWLWLLALASMGTGIFTGFRPSAEPATALIVGGDTLGYLSPCGCVKPMTGGIRRRIAAVRELSVPGRTVVIENGGLVSGTGRQDELKAETLAQSLALVGVSAINLGVREAALGRPALAQVGRLSNGAFVASGLAPDEEALYASEVTRGPFVIGGWDPQAARSAALLGVTARTEADAIGSLVRAAEADGKAAVLMLRGGSDLAASLAEKYPALRFIVYESGSAPPESPVRVGDTVLLTPGDKGKFAVRVLWDGRAYTGYRVIALGPDVADDPDAARIYQGYQRRVDGEDLLEQMPRKETAAYAGSQSCQPCHAEAYEVWEKSEHASALKTLEDDGHDRDPDCTGCHVVGLESVAGFQSRDLTPHLADVGCESCHGPGADHAARPMEVRMPKLGERACLSCHDPNHSPGFDFESYWKKIQH